MKKIPNLFERDWNGDRSRVLPQIAAGADVEWVLRNEGAPTVKWDGSACMVRGGQLFVRYDHKDPMKVPPSGFTPCGDRDAKTGHHPGWIPAVENAAARWHVDAWTNSGGAARADGTYEAIGPQHQSNPYALERNVLVRHGGHPLDFFVPPGATIYQLYAFFVGFLGDFEFRPVDVALPTPMRIEGIVWHHPDGRMAKVLASDLGLSWKAKAR